MEPPENHDCEPDHEQRIPEMRVIAELHIPAAETERRRTNDEQTNNREKWKLRVEIATLVVAAITMGAVIYYACVAHKQWGEMIAANTTSGESAKAAKSAADTVATSLEFSRQQQGAWVIPRIEREFLFRMGRGPENLVSFAVFNYGQSLAVEVVTRAELNTFEEWPRALAEPRLASRVMIPPKTSINQTVGIVTIDNETQMASIASERRKIIIWARLTYMDGVNTNGESYFCRVYSPVIKKFAFCPEDKPWGRDWAK